MQDLFSISWLGDSILLFLGPFMHEDLAIVAGAAYVTEAGLPWLIAFFSLFLGVASSDFAIYGLGRAARHVASLQRILVTDRVRNAGQWLSEHLFAAVIVCHLVPGLLFPTFVACGWFRVPARRFVLASVAMSSAYVCAMLLIMIKFGAFIHQHLSFWTWSVLAIVGLSAGLAGPQPRGETSWAIFAAAPSRPSEPRG